MPQFLSPQRKKFRKSLSLSARSLARALFVCVSMAAGGRKQGFVMASNLLKSIMGPSPLSPSVRSFSVVKSEIITSHTAKWMQDTSKKSPMELINDVPPIKVGGRIAACEGDTDPALGHPIEFICLDLDEPAICKYCGLRYVQDHHH